jgi:hypothetical protein
VADPDLSRLTDQERATYWTGAIVRNDTLLGITLRTILRSLGRRHPADPVPGEPADFEALRLAVVAGVEATFDPEQSREIGEALGDAGRTHRATVELLDALWGVLENSDAFQMLDLLPTDPEQRSPAVPFSESDGAALRRDQVRAYLRLGGVEKVVRHASYTAPFDSESDAARRWAQVRGEFEVGVDGAMEFRDAASSERDVAFGG